MSDTNTGKKIGLTFRFSVIFLLGLLIGLAASAGINFSLPQKASAQTSTVGQTVDPSAGALTWICGLDTAVFEFTPVNINSPDPYFNGYYVNPKTPHTDLNTCDGTGLAIQDTRYGGGFVVQMDATDYATITLPAGNIDVTNFSVVTEQGSISYTEDNTGTTQFMGSGDSLLTGSQDDGVEIQYDLPFDFNFYGTVYNTVFLCDNGMINFSDGDGNSTYDTDSDCTPDPLVVFEDPGPTPHIMGYYKDLNLNFGTDPAFGIYAIELNTDADPEMDEVRFRWSGSPIGNMAEKVEFEITILDDENEDSIRFAYPTAASLKLTDSADDPADSGPLVGVTKGGAASIPVSATYTESTLSRELEGTDLNDKQALFSSGFDFTEVKKPGTPTAIAPYNGSPSHDIDYESMTDLDNDGTSDALDLINGGVTIVPGTCTGGSNDGLACTGDGECPGGYCTEFIPGRIGLYTIYPSFRLSVPNSTGDGTYKNTITFTLQDATGVP